MKIIIFYASSSDHFCVKCNFCLNWLIEKKKIEFKHDRHQFYENYEKSLLIGLHDSYQFYENNEKSYVWYVYMIVIFSMSLMKKWKWYFFVFQISL